MSAASRAQRPCWQTWLTCLVCKVSPTRLPVGMSTMHRTKASVTNIYHNDETKYSNNDSQACSQTLVGKRRHISTASILADLACMLGLRDKLGLSERLPINSLLFTTFLPSSPTIFAYMNLCASGESILGMNINSQPLGLALIDLGRFMSMMGWPTGVACHGNPPGRPGSHVWAAK